MAEQSARKGIRQQIGTRGEDLAVAELERQGMSILARNWRCRAGEIDIVALDPADGPAVVFCEVKCRTGLGFGKPLESITYAKVRRLRQLAGEWLAQTDVAVGRVRIDAIGVVMIRGRAPELSHVRGVQS